MHFQHFSSLSVIASLARLFATSQAVSVNPPALKLQYAWTTTALIELPGITIPIVGGNKTGSSFYHLFFTYPTNTLQSTTSSMAPISPVPSSQGLSPASPR
jgi:hypothetical protein